MMVALWMWEMLCAQEAWWEMGDWITKGLGQSQENTFEGGTFEHPMPPPLRYVVLSHRLGQ